LTNYYVNIATTTSTTLRIDERIKNGTSLNQEFNIAATDK